MLEVPGSILVRCEKCSPYPAISAISNVEVKFMALSVSLMGNFRSIPEVNALRRYITKETTGTHDSFRTESEPFDCPIDSLKTHQY